MRTLATFAAVALAVGSFFAWSLLSVAVVAGSRGSRFTSWSRAPHRCCTAPEIPSAM